MSRIGSKLVSVLMAVTIVLSLGTIEAFAQSATDESIYNVPATRYIEITDYKTNVMLSTSPSTYVPLVGGTAAAVATVTTTTSNPYVAVTVGNLASGMTSVNIRVHDNYYGADIGLDQLQMYVTGNKTVTFMDNNLMIAGHTYIVYMSANGSGGEVSVSSEGITKLQNKQTYALDNVYGSQEIAFEVKSDSPYVKIWCGNTSAHTYYVTVYNSNNEQVDYDTAGSYGTCTLYCNQSALSAGYYKVVVTSEDGYSLSGSLAIKTSESVLY